MLALRLATALPNNLNINTKSIFHTLQDGTSRLGTDSGGEEVDEVKSKRGGSTVQGDHLQNTLGDFRCSRKRV